MTKKTGGITDKNNLKALASGLKTPAKPKTLYEDYLTATRCALGLTKDGKLPPYPPRWVRLATGDAAVEVNKSTTLFDRLDIVRIEPRKSAATSMFTERSSRAKVTDRRGKEFLIYEPFEDVVKKITGVNP